MFLNTIILLPMYLMHVERQEIYDSMVGCVKLKIHRGSWECCPEQQLALRGHEASFGWKSGLFD